MAVPLSLLLALAGLSLGTGSVPKATAAVVMSVFLIESPGLIWVCGAATAWPNRTSSLNESPPVRRRRACSGLR
jgi:hypothetical protein